MERVSRAFLFHEDLATNDEGATTDEVLEHVLWYDTAVLLCCPTKSVI